jgi:hypothetical protein
MGTDEITDEIFEIEDKDKRKLCLYLVYGDKFKQRILNIEDSEHGEFEITKPIAKKIIKELIEEFKIDGGKFFSSQP